jgi:pimeloyl-ACP methyl ester carboxylesterase
MGRGQRYLHRMIATRRHAVRTHAFAVIVAGALIASACTNSSSGVQSERADESAASDETAEEQTDDARGRAGTLAWSPCEDAGNAAVSLECATLQVPLDYSDPDGKQIDIAVARSAATGPAADRVGSLVFNPGGPGASGIDLLGFIPLTMSPEILQRFDLVSFDPRGVGASTALTCDNDLDDEVTLLADGDDAGWQELVDDTATQLDTCTADTIALAPYVGTNNAARDVDLLREALGDEGLSYVGYSYGTRLGATYAELFPENVRALVLDAAVKPSSDSAELDREQGGGFDRALENFAAACDADIDCVLQELGPTLEVIDALETEIADVGSFPTEDPERVLTPGELNLGIAAALYSKESWPILAAALFTAETEQDGSLLQVLGDSLAGRQTDGTYDNSQVANGFINCADDPARPDVNEQRARADEAADLSIYFADFFRASTGCLGIEAATDPLVIGPAAGSAPIVVIGNTGDPATPYEGAQELAGSLDSAVLYTVEAEGHTAYGSIECVQGDIDAYLLELVVPANGSTCSDNADADFFVPEGESEIDQLLAFFNCARDEGADLPDISVADILGDPTLENVLGSIDLTDPSIALAFAACQEFIPGL